jgi:hypothetical protein
MLRAWIALLLAAPCIAGAQLRMGVALDTSSTHPILLNAAERADFVLSARDAQQSLVENWDDIGYDVVLVVQNSRAETDSSRNSWSTWPDGYTWLRLEVNDVPLSVDSVSFAGEPLLYFTVTKSAFELGKAAVSFMQSRADSNIFLTVTPLADFLPQQSPPINVCPGEHADYLLDITSPFVDSDDVYVLRKYEVCVSPRDRYTNLISGQEIPTNITARFPSEFDVNYPRLSNPFAEPMKLDGLESFFLVSRLRREDVKSEDRQWLRAISTQDSTVAGTTSPYQILDHAPYPFDLQSPGDQSIIRLMRRTDVETFTWVKPTPADPYTDIQVSRFDPLRISDEIRYELQFIDAKSYTRSVRFEASNDGADPTLVLDHIQLSTLIDQLSGQLIERSSIGVLWFAVARDFDNTDGLMLGPLYATESNPVPVFQGSLPGFRLTLSRDFLVVPVAISGVEVPGFVLHQNYPNPFNPSTTIALQVPNPGHCRLLVYNLLGEEVAVLHDGFLDAGEHSFSFNGGGRSSGLYSCRFESGDIALTRWMTLLR